MKKPFHQNKEKNIYHLREFLQSTFAYLNSIEKKKRVFFNKHLHFSPYSSFFNFPFVFLTIQNKSMIIWQTFSNCLIFKIIDLLDYEIIINQSFTMSQYSSYFYHPSDDGQQMFLLEQFAEVQRQFPTPSEHSQEKQIYFTNYTQHNLSAVQTVRRSFSLIEISEDVRQSYIKARKGSPQETMELHHNFKTFTSQLLKDLLILKILNQQEIRRCWNFFKQIPSFQSFSDLFFPNIYNSLLVKNSKQFFCSSSIIKKILRSKIRLYQKKRLLKFLEKIRSIIQNKNQKQRWKSL